MQDITGNGSKVSLIDQVMLDGNEACLSQFRVRSIDEEERIGRALMVKRALDTFLVLLAMPVLIPLFALLAVLIKLDSRGEVFFKQTRTGLNGKTFSIFKFRSMTEIAGKDNKASQSQKNDLRHTRMGRVLRATSLDELPQLINVLKGDMSLIGPRPHALYHDKVFAKLAFGYPERFRMRPGLTGLAQVAGSRGFIETQEEIQARTTWDNQYINNWSFFSDMIILLKTVLVVFKGTNAH